MGILNGNPKNEPMHYGEVYGVWNYVLMNSGALAAYQTFINHTGDQDLKTFLEDITKNVIKPELDQAEELLKINGIALPPRMPERPNASLESIPAGARFNDPEIAASVTKDISTGLVTCSQVIGQCIREDIVLMFTQFHASKVTYGGRLLRINKAKGWLIPPPLNTEVNEPAYV